MKEFIINTGEKILNILFILTCVVIVFYGIGIMTTLGGIWGVLGGLLAIVVGLGIAVVSFFLIYVLLDIREQLIKANAKN